jgi:hypothetical protein
MPHWIKILKRRVEPVPGLEALTLDYFFGRERNIISEQGDQIGRIFPLVFFGQFSENFRNSPYFWATLLHGKSYVFSNFSKK